MASFLLPVSRAKAESLVDERLERVRDDNADPDKPLTIIEVGVLGSFLDPSVDRLGDVDITAELAGRGAINEQGQGQQYARRSGRRFSTFIDELLSR